MVLEDKVQVSEWAEYHRDMLTSRVDDIQSCCPDTARDTLHPIHITSHQIIIYIILNSYYQHTT